MTTPTPKSMKVNLHVTLAAVTARIEKRSVHGAFKRVCVTVQ